jgi:hypothetical protein
VELSYVHATYICHSPYDYFHVDSTIPISGPSIWSRSRCGFQVTLGRYIASMMTEFILHGGLMSSTGCSGCHNVITVAMDI